MTDRELERLRSLRGDLGGATPQCFDEDTIGALAEGTLDESSRVALLPHLATCAHCRRAVASVAQALEDSKVAREMDGGTGVGRRRWFRLALPAVAAAVLLLVFGWPRSEEGGGHRGPPGANVPVPIAPIGIVAGAHALEWTAVPGADRYRVTLSTADGHALYEAQFADTVAALPDSIRLLPGQRYVWLVEARTGFDRWSTSRLVEFSIGR